ncbi:MAG: aldo/keto reductase [Candidatus Saccharimonadales bacterium]
MNVPTLKLADERSIPQVGLGLWKVKDKAEFEAAFEVALAAGYTHFDSAQAYENEQFLGACWQASGRLRESFWLTTKIRTETIAIGRTAQSFTRSLERLQTDYVDLLLLHFPVPIARKKAWKELEKIKAAGGAKSIGVSNYTIKHLEEMKLYATEMPVVNQVEWHVFLQQPELVDYCRRNGIVIEAYSPLAHAKDMKNPDIQAMAERHSKSYAQIMLRWCVENGLVLLPKSTTPERIRENIDLYDFELYLEELQALTKLNRGLRTCWDPTHIP